MNSIHQAAEQLQALLRQAGAEQYACTVSESQKRELNTELSDFTLLRTIFDSSAAVTVIQEHKKGAASGSDLSPEGLKKVVEDAVEGAASSMADEANALAEEQAPQTFRSGPYEADMERFYDRVSELLEEIAQRYPQVRVGQIIADHTQTHQIYLNSNGTRFESFDGVYHVSLEMAGADGDKVTGLHYTQLATHDLDTPLLAQGGMEAHVADTQRSLTAADIPEKFEGTVIFTPDCLGYFLYMLLSNYVMGSVILDGTSQWLDKVGQPVASPRVTLTLKAADDRIAECAPYTTDGYVAEDVTILEDGVLKNQILNLYAARKTGRPVTKNTGFALVMEAGETPLERMIAAVKEGLIVGGFSGGQPGANGEFSGVAKNSFYVRDGRVVGAVTETMINGNLEKVFQNVLDISREQACDGTSVLPYMACDGIVISGK